jgi:hypothetical protein
MSRILFSLIILSGVFLLSACDSLSFLQPTPTPTLMPTPTPTLTPTPTPTLTPTPDPGDELIGACFGKPVPWASPYGGKVHPLVVAGPRGGWNWLPNFDINQKWRDGEWTSSMIQLVLCPENAEPKEASCGTYKIVEEVTGELIQLRDAVTIRVVAAQTGKTLQSTTLYAEIGCPASFGVPLLGDPPWTFSGDPVTFAQIDEYATAVSMQPVK